MARTKSKVRTEHPAKLDATSGGFARRSRPTSKVEVRERKLQLLEGRGRSERLDRLVHERIRLGIVSALAVNDALTFSELKRLLRTTDGNLSVHARKLEHAGYIACTKAFEDRLPRTTYRLTASGRRALGRYLDHMEALIRAARSG